MNTNKIRKIKLVFASAVFFVALCSPASSFGVKVRPEDVEYACEKVGTYKHYNGKYYLRERDSSSNERDSSSNECYDVHRLSEIMAEMINNKQTTKEIQRSLYLGSGTDYGLEIIITVIATAKEKRRSIIAKKREARAEIIGETPFQRGSCNHFRGRYRNYFRGQPYGINMRNLESDYSSQISNLSSLYTKIEQKFTTLEGYAERKFTPLEGYARQIIKSEDALREKIDTVILELNQIKNKQHFPQDTFNAREMPFSEKHEAQEQKIFSNIIMQDEFSHHIKCEKHEVQEQKPLINIKMGDITFSNSGTLITQPKNCSLDHTLEGNTGNIPLHSKTNTNDQHETSEESGGWFSTTMKWIKSLFN
ncbi:hypothetical protein [Candidatus Hydrogenosomobacter endosymbioticus]|uniref:Secreted protein n=1 Tax=Candidatus Hydrogenosomobacter endosymbioticus TaxID=2558174 RepID=A0ABN6L2S4_9PROT|nr:hypothetical protein [Candidatus Hydrogenosomobacter endosymbioticus]BDB96164.1 hypothetical protein HYD_2970 [Candidatus Hydrogenosomobacter endosymbioticus]